MSEQDKPRKSGLGRSAMFGAASQILSRSARALVGVATVSILSRFMGPAEFGIAALILFLIIFAQIFTDFGLRMVLVQRPQINELELSSVFWFSLAISCLVSLAVYFGAGLIAAAFQEPKLEPYVEIVAAVIVVATLRGVPLAVLERNLQFSAIASSDVVGAVVGSALAIAAAFQGYTVGALVLQQVAMSVVPTVMNFVSSRWVPRLRFSIEALRPMIGFGSTMTASNLIGFLVGNIDRPLLASQLSAADLGLYSMTSQIVGVPLRTIAISARRVTFPIMSMIQNDDSRVAAAHRDSVHAMFLVLAPTCLGLAALADPFVAIVLGPQWGQVGALVSVAAISSLVWSVAELNLGIFSARGAARFLLYWGIYSLVVTFAILLLGAPYGLLAIVWIRLVWTFFDSWLNYWFLARLLQCRALDLVRPLWRPAVAASLMALVVALADRQLVGGGAGPIVRLALGVPLGVVVYAGLILLVDGAQVKELVRRIRGRKPTSA